MRNSAEAQEQSLPAVTVDAPIARPKPPAAKPSPEQIRARNAPPSPVPMVMRRGAQRNPSAWSEILVAQHLLGQHGDAARGVDDRFGKFRRGEPVGLVGRGRIGRRVLYATLADENFFTEQIEILKGPAATIDGRGTTGGAINIVTKQASDVASFYNADTKITSDFTKRVTFDVN